MMNRVLDYLDILIPDARCELNYTKDYELLIAVMLSAQTTDKRVNMVSDLLFKKYPDLESLSNADIEDIIKIIKPIGTYTKKAKNIIEISKSLIFKCMEELKKIEVDAPIKIGDIILPNVLGTGIDIVSCRDLDKI